MKPVPAPQSAPRAKTVRKRHVFFIPGYDPNVPRRYRELYRRESVKQAEILGYDIAVSGLSRQDNYRWAVQAEIDGSQTDTVIEFLTWEDIVRKSMDRSIVSSLFVLVRTCWIYGSSGALWRLIRLRPQPMIAAFYPVVVIAVQFLLAFLLGWGIAALVPGAAGPALGVLAFVGVVAGFRRLDRYIFAYYLINDYGFTARRRGRYPQPLRARLDVFSQRLQEACDTDVDEVLVIGHSSGAQLAVTAVAGAVDAVRDDGPVLSLLTLGQVIPMMSFLPNAQELRGHLNMLSQCDRIAWVDVSAPGDGGCFALSDPVHVTGVAPPEPVKYWPKVLSAAYTLSLSPELARKTKWRFFRRHIQYFCAFDRPRDYDYFQITAGPMTLEDRFAWRGATASRTETPLSGYRDF